MSKHDKVIFFLAVMLFAVFGCKPKETIQHPGDIPIGNLNNSLRLSAPPAWNTFMLNKPVDLEIVNLSKKNIVFDRYFGKRIYFRQDGQFIEVENEIVVIGDQDFVMLKPGNSVGTAFRVTLDGDGQRLLRVYVTGVFENTTEAVTAYLDIRLYPK